MGEGRPAIPAELKRSVLVEAGHRCAIPACRHPTTEIAHIRPWAKAQEHSFENLIALCPNCHRRFDRGEIDRRAMEQYKANLGLLNNRYSDEERRLIEYFVHNPREGEVILGGDHTFAFMYLIRDGLLQDLSRQVSTVSFVDASGVEMPSHFVYALTPKGLDFVARAREARELDSQPD